VAWQRRIAAFFGQQPRWRPWYCTASM